MISSSEIEVAKKRTRYGNESAHHEHDDCIRIAYEWFDAQTKTKGTTKKRWALKHIIEKWGGRYVSQSDVEVAATLHPDVIGSYPHYNISARLILPHDARLTNLGEARTQDYKISDPSEVYVMKEGGEKIIKRDRW